jgi:hypothetical protein
MKPKQTSSNRAHIRLARALLTLGHTDVTEDEVTSYLARPLTEGGDAALERRLKVDPAVWEKVCEQRRICEEHFQPGPLAAMQARLDKTFAALATSDPAKQKAGVFEVVSREREVIVRVAFRCEEFALGLAACDPKPVAFKIGNFSVQIICKDSRQKQLVIFVTAVWNGEGAPNNAVLQTLRFSHKGRALGSVTEWRPGLAEGRWVGDTVVSKSARVGIVKTDELEAAFL